MSALSTSRPRGPVVLIPDDAHVPLATPAPASPTSSPESCYSPLPSLTHSSPSSSSSSIHSVPERTNEHLAILLPKHLWKPDSFASRCDNLYCPVRFSVFERRHHCRKCGGVFCASCTSRSTSLLDTSNLSFLHPPRNVPISSFASPISPFSPCRVCDDCWDQVHGNPTTPRTPDIIRPTLTRMLSSPISMLKSPLSSSPATSGNSSLASSADLPRNMGQHPLAASETISLLATAAPLARKTRSLRTAPSISSLNGHRRSIIRASHLTLPPELDRSYGELDAYPLRRSSILCKATGGGRWEPKQEPALIGYRPPVPGGKAQYELEMEQHAREEQTRKENPIVKDGDFQYRFTREPDSMVMARSPFAMSTF
ncbi:FYVE zinc finger-domain-containing protein [Lyophyllum atratum]|nr:FYVE zinc finger-domain-containing protein [Lyophyllum atratum]